ncbi:hypothetical protein [Tatumella sp. UBA2305]|uniref:hypothetical protein n=1 Tax=Tatumella sp. UBA2305 TaxID=1947647 RepID=UPI0025E0A025|nr:hypothetical protein [Tatumella sp. UBA2305]
MSKEDDFTAAKAICNEIGGAVLELLGDGQSLSVEGLVTVMQQAQQDGHSYGEQREEAMLRAIRLLQKFIS